MVCHIIYPLLYTVVILCSICVSVSLAQVGIFSKSDLIEYTPLWKGERFPDGRPKVPDDIMERMKGVSIEEAWGTLAQHGFNHQFENGWVMTEENPVLVGRAVTAYFMPLRPDINDIIGKKGEKEGRIGAQNSWIIDTLVKGDVIVVTMSGNIIDGAFMGDNLANSIYAKSGGTGVVVDGGSRDLEGVNKIPDFPVFTRGWGPSVIKDRMLMGINTPVLIGQASVMPGDVVLGKREGIIFIPAHLAQEVVESSEIVRLRDQFGHQRLREGKYTPGEIDRRWTDNIEKDFMEWLKVRENEVTPYQRENLFKKETDKKK